MTEFANVYKQNPALTRILISEVFREDSVIRSYFLQQWPVHGKTMIADTITHLSALGYYRKDVNIEGIFTMIHIVVYAPLILKPYFAPKGDQLVHYLDDQWIDFVSTVFDSYLRPQKDQCSSLAVI